MDKVLSKILSLPATITSILVLLGLGVTVMGMAGICDTWAYVILGYWFYLVFGAYYLYTSTHPDDLSPENNSTLN